MRQPLIEITPDQSVYDPATATCYVLITVTPAATDQPAQCLPRNLCLILDRSGSMHGPKIKAARDAACRVVDSLLPTDRLSVLAFDDQIEVVCSSQLVTDKTELKSKILGITVRGNTALHEAWVRGAMELNRFVEEYAHNRILLLTDGEANVGETNPATIIRQSKEMASRHLSTSTIGIGNDFNEELLIPMASAGMGNAWHVVESEDIQKVLVSELQGMTAQVGSNVRLKMVPSAGVELLDVVNDLETSPDGWLKLANLCLGIPLQIVFKVKLTPPQSSPALLTVSLHWTDQASGVPAEMKAENRIWFTSEAEAPAFAINREVKKNAYLLRIARHKTKAIAHLDQDRINSAAEEILTALRLIKIAEGEIGEDPALTEQDRILGEFHTMLASGDRKGTRKSLRYSSYIQQTSRSGFIN